MLHAGMVASIFNKYLRIRSEPQAQLAVANTKWHGGWIICRPPESRRAVGFKMLTPDPIWHRSDGPGPPRWAPSGQPGPKPVWGPPPVHVCFAEPARMADLEKAVPG